MNPKFDPELIWIIPLIFAYLYAVHSLMSELLR